MTDNKDLKKIRDQIDKVDDKIFTLIEKRINLVYKIGHLKGRENLPMIDEAREKEVISRIVEQARNSHLSADFLEEIYKTIMQESRNIQKLRE